jgi:hypothetical protein
MSQVRANSITNAAGTGAPDLPNGATFPSTAGASTFAGLMGYTTTATTGGTTFLTNTSTQCQVFTGTSTETVRMPDTSTLATGWTFQIFNYSSNSLFIRASSASGSFIQVLQPFATMTVTCISTAVTDSDAWVYAYDGFVSVTGTGSAVLADSPTLTGAASFTGVASFADGTAAAPSITNAGDTNTGIFFPAADTVSIATNGGEGFRIDAAGNAIFYKGIIETVFALSGTTPALDPVNGTIQTWTLSGNSSPTDSLVAGESITLMIDDGSAFTITWPSVTWKTNAGSAPTLNTTGFTVIVLWKVGSTLYGARVGDA